MLSALVDVLYIFLLAFVQFLRILTLQQLRKADDGIERRSKFMGHVREEFGLEAVGFARFLERLLETIGFARFLERQTELRVLPTELIPVSFQQASRKGRDECDHKQQPHIHQHDDDLTRPRYSEGGVNLIGPKNAQVFERHHEAEADDAESGDDKGQSAGGHHPYIDDEGSVEGKEESRLDASHKVDDEGITDDFQ